MKSYEVKTEIAAPAAEVYKVLMDFNNYPIWNPFIVKMSGTPTVGETIHPSVKIGDRPASKFSAVVVKNEPNRELRWVGTILGAFIYRGEHFFKIEDTDGGCILTHGEVFTGLMEPIVTKMLGKDMEASYELLNVALKHRAQRDQS